MARILITDPNYKHTLGIVRSLGKSGDYQLDLLSKRNFSLSSLSKYVSENVVYSDYNILSLESNVDFSKYDCILPVGSLSNKIFAQSSVSLKNKMLLPPTDSFDISISKERTYLHAKKISLPVPDTYYPEKISDVVFISKNISFPCVIKAREEMGANVVEYATCPNELIEKFNTMVKTFNLENNLPLIQTYIDGFGCAFFGFYINGKMHASFQHKRIREFPPSGGVSVCAESYFDPELEKLGTKLLDSLHWNGVAMVEFKKSSTGYVLLEINSKFWGSLDLALSCGIDFPNYICNYLINQKVPDNSKYKINKRFHWPLNGDLIHVFLNFKNLRYFVSDLLNPNVESNLSISDPLPTIYLIFIQFPYDILKLTLNKLRK